MRPAVNGRGPGHNDRTASEPAARNLRLWGTVATAAAPDSTCKQTDCLVRKTFVLAWPPFFAQPLFTILSLVIEDLRWTALR